MGIIYDKIRVLIRAKNFHRKIVFDEKDAFLPEPFLLYR